MIPSRKKCIELLRKYELSESKIEHCLLVEKTAVNISKLLQKKKVKINITLVSRAALLHDIGKERSKQVHKEHAIVGSEICKIEKIDEKICEIVRHHILEAIINDKLNSIEEKIVFYSDKICKNELLGITKRFAPWLEKHPSTSLSLAKEKTIKLEKEIINKLELTSNQLYTILKTNLR